MIHIAPLKAIRKNCIDCSGGSLKEVGECAVADCALFPFRFGRNPHRHGMRKAINNTSAEASGGEGVLPYPQTEMGEKTSSQG